MLFGDILGGFLFFCGKVASMQGILSHQFGILNAVLTSSRVYKIAKRKHDAQPLFLFRYVTPLTPFLKWNSGTF